MVIILKPILYLFSFLSPSYSLLVPSSKVLEGPRRSSNESRSDSFNDSSRTFHDYLDPGGCYSFSERTSRRVRDGLTIREQVSTGKPEKRGNAPRYTEDELDRMNTALWLDG